MRFALVLGLLTVAACRGERGPVGPPGAPATSPTAAQVAQALASDPEFARAVAHELAAHSQQASIPVDVPRDGGAVASVTVAIDAQGRLSVDGHSVTQAELVGQVRARISDGEQIRAVIAADRRATQQSTVGVIDSLRAIGVTRFAIATDAPF